MLNQNQIVNDSTVNDLVYCLLEDDLLISGILVETQRLLSRANSSKHEVRFVIEVEIRVVKPRAYTISGSLEIDG